MEIVKYLFGIRLTILLSFQEDTLYVSLGPSGLVWAAIALVICVWTRKNRLSELPRALDSTFQLLQELLPALDGCMPKVPIFPGSVCSQWSVEVGYKGMAFSEFWIQRILQPPSGSPELFMCGWGCHWISSLWSLPSNLASFLPFHRCWDPKGTT